MITTEKLIELLEKDRRKSQGILPELIKRLIIASTNKKLSSLRFPSHDDIWAPGFDGFIKNVDEDTEYVPKGNSVWELSLNKQYKGKISSDYKKRTQEGFDFDKEDYTYIAVTPYIYNEDILQVENEFKSDRVWKDVRVYDGSMLTDWLKEHVEVLIWFFEHFDETGIDIKIHKGSLFLKKYMEKTNPNLNKELILCSQNNNEGNVIKKFNKEIISKDRGPLILFSPVSLEHGLLFSLKTLSENKALFLKTIVAYNVGSLEFVEKNFKDKIVVINFDWVGRGIELKNNRYIYIVVEPGKQNDIKLNNIRFNDFNNSLKGMGFDSGKSFNLTQRTNRNISSLIRHIAVNKLDKNPIWAVSPYKKLIIPMALLSEVNVKNRYDMEFVSKISNDKNYMRDLNELLELTDSPLFKFQDIYKVNYKEEALFILNLNFRDKYINDLETEFKNIIMKGEISNYSKNLIRGIIDTFTIMAIKSKTNQSHYDDFVYNLLIEAINKEKSYNSILGILYELSELSPKGIISFFYKCLDENNHLFKKTIEQNQEEMNYFSNRSIYSYKHAIDRCLYEKETSIKTFNLLLEMYLKNYRYPSVFNMENYIKEVFSPISSVLIPISPIEKLEILIRFINDDSEKSNKLNSIFETFFIGSKHSYFYVAPIFKYRLNPEKRNIETRELYDVNEKAVNYLLENTMDKPGLFESVLKTISYQPEKVIKSTFENLVRYIEKANNSEKISINFLLLRKIHDINFYYNENNDNVWSKLYSYINDLVNLYNKSIPDSPYDKYKYIFQNHFFDIPLLSYVRDSNLHEDLKKQKKETLKVYDEAFKKIFEKESKNSAIKIINESVDEGTIGIYLAKYSKRHCDNIKVILELNKTNILTGYIEELSIKKSKDIYNNLSEEQKLKLIKSIGLTKTSYSLIEGTEFEKEYWLNKKFIKLDDREVYFQQIIHDNLFKYNPITLLGEYAYGSGKISIDRKLGLLEAIIQSGVNDIEWENTKVYALNELINQLDKALYNDQLVQVELMLLPYSMKVVDYDYPKGIKRFFSENPKQLYQYLREVIINKREAKLIREKILSDITFSLGRNIIVSIEYFRDELEKVKDNKYEDFKMGKMYSWFLTINEELKKETLDEVKYVVSNLMIDILTRLYDFNQDKKTNDIVGEILELVTENKKYKERINTANTLASKVFNRYGIRNISDGSKEIEFSNNIKKQSEKYKILNPTLYLALNYLSDKFKDIGYMDRDEQILGIY